MPLQDFDARSVTPQQPGGMGSHPCGIHEFQISNTHLAPSENNNHLMLHVEFTSPVGRHMERFIVDGNSPKAIEIAQKQIAALCHAVNIFQVTYPKLPDGSIDMANGGRSLRGGRGRFDIGFQKGSEPTAEKPEGGYVEVKKYYDMNGNEPGKQGSAPQPQPAQQQPQGQQAPMQQQPSGGWGQQQPNQNNASQQQQPAPQAQQWGGGGQPANAGPTAAPPWGK